MAQPERLWLAGTQHECRARWERVGFEGTPYSALVSIGTLNRGGWFVHVLHRGGEARAYPDEGAARTVAQAWMDHIGGQWRHIPCIGWWWQPGERDEKAGSPGTIRLYQVKHRCHARWQRTTLPEYQVRGQEISIGELDDGRWYVDVVKYPPPDECHPHPDRRVARDAAEQWKLRLGGEWEQVPCDPTVGWQPGEREDQAGASEQV